MSKSDAFENALLLLLFNNTNIANLGDATGVRGSAAAGSLYLSLHTADPGDVGNEATNECNYTGYARKAVARTSAGFVVANNQVNLAADQDFGAKTAGTDQTATHWGVGIAASGATMLLYKGAIAPTIPITNGTIPRLTTGTNVTED